MIINTTQTEVEKKLVLGDVNNKRYTHSYFGPWLEKDENGEWQITDKRAMILNMTQGKVDIEDEQK